MAHLPKSTNTDELHPASTAQFFICCEQTIFQSIDWVLSIQYPFGIVAASDGTYCNRRTRTNQIGQPVAQHQQSTTHLLTTAHVAMNPPSTRIRKRRALRRPLPDPHQTPSGTDDFSSVIAKILKLDSIAKAKLPGTIKAARCINTSHTRILLRISNSSRATTNRPSDITCWRDFICACASVGSCPGIGAGTSKNTV